MKIVYEFQVPALCSEQAARRLRGELDMRSGIVMQWYDLGMRRVRLVGNPDRDQQLRRFLGSIGFAPVADDPALPCQHRRLHRRRRSVN